MIMIIVTFNVSNAMIYSNSRGVQGIPRGEDIGQWSVTVWMAVVLGVDGL